MEPFSTRLSPSLLTQTGFIIARPICKMTTSLRLNTTVFYFKIIAISTAVSELLERNSTIKRVFLVTSSKSALAALWFKDIISILMKNCQEMLSYL